VAEIDAQEVLALPSPLREATRFRSTWLTASVLALRDRGHFDAYVRALPEPYHARILQVDAQIWVPLEYAMVHYRACDLIGLENAEVETISEGVTRHIHGGSLSIVLRLARTTGVTPWVALQQLNRLWERVWEGGGCQVSKVGPKDAVVEVAGWPPSQFLYVQMGIPAICKAILQLFSRSVVARYDGVGRHGQTSMRVHVAWA
jgi:hypothetical protein